MTDSNPNNKSFELLSESEKSDIENLKLKINLNISLSQTERNANIKRAYDLRHGIRDEEQFNHITKKYGVEFPAQLTHTPLIDRHVKTLEGEMEELPLNYRITCLDKTSLEKHTKEKKEKSAEAFTGQVNKFLKSLITSVNNGTENVFDHFSEEELNKLEKQNAQFKSKLEISAQHVLNYELQNIKFKGFSDKTFSDISTCGEEHYVSKLIADGKEHWFQRIDPSKLFYIKPSSVDFVEDCDMIVYKNKESITTILSKWGYCLTKEDLKKLRNGSTLSNDFIVLSSNAVSTDDQINDNYGLGADNIYHDVYYTEWKSVNIIDTKTREDLYHGVRIGNDVYVETGKYKYVKRNPDSPKRVTLNFNGVLYDEYQSKARSMFLDTEDVQNEYDIYNFHLDNAIALSGNKVQTVILENIPVNFGNDETERLLKHQEYTKHGFNYVSLSQEGAQQFNNYGQAVDLSLGSGIQSLVSILTMLEQRASTITGVSPAQMGEVSPYAGQGQTKLVVNRSSLVVRKLFSTHFKFCQAALSSILNNCRTLYKKGYKGAYLLGDELVEFTIDDDFELSYMGVFISSELFEWKAIEDYKQMAVQLAGQGAIDVVDSIDVYTSKSMTEIKQKLTENANKKKQDNTKQLQQQLEQATKQIQKLEGESKKYNEAELQLETEKIKVDREKLAQEKDIKQKELDELIKSNADLKEIKLKQLDLEQLQVTFSSSSREVKNI